MKYKSHIILGLIFIYKLKYIFKNLIFLSIIQFIFIFNLKIKILRSEVNLGWVKEGYLAFLVINRMLNHYLS